MTLHPRSRVESRLESGQFDIVHKSVSWDPKKTAVIICDMWDSHYCKSAAARVAEMARRANDFVAAARQRGSLVVHAPSGCMAFYAGHPARRRAQDAPKVDLPKFLGSPCDRMETEKNAAWPLDQSDGGCDCTPPCPVCVPFHRQIGTIKIADEDAISDSGVEVGNLFAQRGIDNVIMLGVHTNMCVVGRSFGLRNLVRLGKNVVLVRDLTDTMYNHRKPPCVSHFRGTELDDRVHREIHLSHDHQRRSAGRGGLPVPCRPAAARRARKLRGRVPFRRDPALLRPGAKPAIRLLLQFPPGRPGDRHSRAGGTGHRRRFDDSTCGVMPCPQSRWR